SGLGPSCRAIIPGRLVLGLADAEPHVAGLALYAHQALRIAHERPGEASAHHLRAELRRADAADGDEAPIAVALGAFAANCPAGHQVSECALRNGSAIPEPAVRANALLA